MASVASAMWVLRYLESRLFVVTFAPLFVETVTEIREGREAESGRKSSRR